MQTARLLSSKQVDAAVAILRNGGLLGLPTETVYGLAANAEDSAAVGRIFSVKGRPTSHPLIVHIASADKLDEWAVDIPDYAVALAEKFWPGPMTLVLKRSERVQDFVTGGQPTVGIRVPSNRTAQAILQSFSGGLAAPSANRFGQVSPTTADHVVKGLAGHLDFSRDAVIDGGSSEVGLESTIIDCTAAAPKILRPGSITALQIAEVTNLEIAAADGSIVVPGSLDAHYAPKAKVHLVSNPLVLHDATAGAGFFALAAVTAPADVVRLGSPIDATAFAQELYAALHQADELQLKNVFIVVPAGSGVEIAIQDRVAKAATGSGGTK
jgi:L-threonylcarbamoyladenylate synthase